MQREMARDPAFHKGVKPKRLPQAIRLHLTLAATACLAVGVTPQAEAFDPVVPLSSLDGSTGFRLDGVASGDMSGYSVSGAGDINGDGIDDLIIGAYKADPVTNREGSGYVVFGQTAPYSSIISLSTLDGTTGFRLDGVANGGELGTSVSSAGDINGDGIDDLIIGAPNATPVCCAEGISYVMFGQTAPFAATISVSTLDGSNGFRLDGQDGSLGNWSGYSVSAAGDINGDGIDDLLIGAPQWDLGPLTYAGASYVVFGQTAPFSSIISLSTLDGTTGFRLDPVIDHEWVGGSVSGVGDINGDNIDDLLVGAKYGEEDFLLMPQSGVSYVVFGQTTSFSSAISLSTLDGTTGFRLTGYNNSDESGHSVSGVGDINGDGIDDLIIGAHYADPAGSKSGSSYVVFGQTTPFAATVRLSTLNGSTGFRLDGVNALDQSGYSVGGAGDINGDGIDDLLIGAPYADPVSNGEGSTYVVFGRTAAFSSVISLSSLDGTTGFRLDGVGNADASGRSVSNAGDVNGDGADDLIIGAPTADPVSNSEGSSYLVFGEPLCGHQATVAGGKWKMVGIPCDPGTNNTVAKVFGPDLDVSGYLTEWVVYDRDATLDAYRQLALTDTLNEGEGVWVFSNGSTNLKVGATGISETAANNVNPLECLYVNGCFEILLEPPTVGGTSRFNLVGHPHPETIDWATVNFVIDGGAPLSPAAAQAANMVSKTYFIYNGNSYDSLDDVTPGLGGTLSAYDGIWVEVLDGALGATTVKMLVPFDAMLGVPPPLPI